MKILVFLILGTCNKRPCESQKKLILIVNIPVVHWIIYSKFAQLHVPLFGHNLYERTSSGMDTNGVRILLSILILSSFGLF